MTYVGAFTGPGHVCRRAAFQGDRRAEGIWSQHFALLSRDFVRLISFSLLIAVPLTWYGINQWLDGFAYRIDFNLVLVLVAGGLALFVALVTVSYQSFKAAVENPVKSLRSE